MERMTEAVCCVLGCPSSPLTGQTFHFFPPYQEKGTVPFKDESGGVSFIGRREVWMMLLRLNSINQKTRVCSKHFQDSEFQKTRRPTSTSSEVNKNMLRTCSLPTLFLPKPLCSGEQHYIIKDLEKLKNSGPSKSKKIILGVTAYVCCVPDCLHSNIINDCKLFVIPNNPFAAKVAWNEFTSKFKEYIKNESRVCSCHFLDGLLDDGPLMFPSDFEDALGLTKEKRNQYIFQIVPSSIETWNLISESYLIESNDIEEKKNEITKSPASPISCSISSDIISRVDYLKDDVNVFCNLSGFKSLEIFEIFLSIFDQDYIDVLTERKRSLPFSDQILLCLIKLKHNHSFSFIGKDFLIVSGDAKGIFERCSAVMENVFCDGILDVGKLKLKETLWQQLPECNRVFFVVEVILENSEPSQSPSSTNSNNVIIHKSLVSVTPAGTITYVGPFFIGSVPNEEIINKSQLASATEPGDIIFIDDVTIVQVKDVSEFRLILTKAPFSFSSEIQSHVASHVNKIKSELLSYNIIKFLPTELNHLSLRIWRVICAIVNFNFVDPQKLKEFYLEMQDVIINKEADEDHECNYIDLFDDKQL